MEKRLRNSERLRKGVSGERNLLRE
jgi:hypothetical protein